MSTIIYFIRHAEPSFESLEDSQRGLTDKGLQDAKDIVNLLGQQEIHFSSPYKRSIDTIRPLAHHFQKDITIVNDFRERKISTTWIDNFNQFAERQWADFSYSLPGGESLYQVEKRNITALEKILDQFVHQTIVIGTHGTALGTILHYYNPNFGFADFDRFKSIFPYIICLRFNGKEYQSSFEISISKRLGE